MSLNPVFQLMPNRSELQDEISGKADWQEKSYNVGVQGSHTLKRCFYKDGAFDGGQDCGWVDYVQWTSSPAPPSDPPPPPPGPTAWDTITYKYDLGGGRVLCLCYRFALCGELSGTPTDSGDGSGRSGSGLLVKPWPVQLACTSLAWRTFVNVTQT